MNIDTTAIYDLLNRIITSLDSGSKKYLDVVGIDHYHDEQLDVHTIEIPLPEHQIRFVYSVLTDASRFSYTGLTGMRHISYRPNSDINGKWNYINVSFIGAEHQSLANLCEEVYFRISLYNDNNYVNAIALNKILQDAVSN